MNQEYVKTKENDGLKKLREWNTRYGFFDNITQTKMGTSDDAICTHKGKEYYVEYKDRNFKSLKEFSKHFRTVFIEPYKFAFLLSLQVLGKSTYYINFFGKDVVIFNMKKMAEQMADRRLGTYKGDVKDHGLGAEVEVQRLCLPLTAATVYEYDSQSS